MYRERPRPPHISGDSLARLDGTRMTDGRHQIIFPPSLRTEFSHPMGTRDALARLDRALSNLTQRLTAAGITRIGSIVGEARNDIRDGNIRGDNPVYEVEVGGPPITWKYERKLHEDDTTTTEKLEVDAVRLPSVTVADGEPQLREGDGDSYTVFARRVYDIYLVPQTTDSVIAA